MGNQVSSISADSLVSVQAKTITGQERQETKEKPPVFQNEAKVSDFSADKSELEEMLAKNRKK